MEIAGQWLVAILAWEIGGNTVNAWLIAIAIGCVTFIIGRLVYWFSNRVLKRLAERTTSKLDDILLDMGEEPVVLAISLLGTRLGLETLVLSEAWTHRIEDGYHVLTALNIGWALTRILDAVDVHYLRPYVDSTATPVDNTLLPVVRTLVKFGIWLGTLLVGISNAGYDIMAVLGGLGIGGLAFALAAQDTVANAFGGITVLTLRPFTVGDRIQFDGNDGWVTSISVRNTKLKTWKGDEVTVPNKIFTDTAVSNLSRRQAFWQESEILLRHDTSAKQIREFLEEFRQYCKDHRQVADIAYGSLDGIQRDHFKVNLVYGVNAKEPGEPWPDHYGKEMAIRTEVNLHVLEMLAAHNLFIALPMHPKIELPPVHGAPFAYNSAPVRSAAAALLFEAEARAAAEAAAAADGRPPENEPIREEFTEREEELERADTAERGEAEQQAEAERPDEPNPV